MSAADKDGRIARMLGDRLACLSIEIHESLLEASDRLAAEFPPDADA